jgi:hypothetical protein
MYGGMYMGKPCGHCQLKRDKKYKNSFMIDLHVTTEKVSIMTTGLLLAQYAKTI